MGLSDSVVENIHRQRACCRGHLCRRRLGGDSVNREAHQESSVSLSQAEKLENRQSVVYTVNIRLNQQRSGRLPLERKEKTE